jgi:DNA-binding NarL/FixJ family response regulator
MLRVDDHVIVREGLKHVLDPIGGDLIEAETGFQALGFLREREFDLALVDLSLRGMGLNCFVASRASSPACVFLCWSIQAKEQYALRAFKAGADGYVTKGIAAREMVGAVRKVAAGGTYVTEGVAESVVQQLNGLSEAPRHAMLADRELDVLRRVAAGQRLTEIGLELHLSVQ